MLSIVVAFIVPRRPNQYVIDAREVPEVMFIADGVVGSTSCAILCTRCSRCGRVPRMSLTSRRARFYSVASASVTATDRGGSRFRLVLADRHHSGKAGAGDT